MSSEDSMLNELIEEELGMDAQRIKHCHRCHGALYSTLIEENPDRPLIKYKKLNLCTICNDTEYADPKPRSPLPKPSESLLCKCVHTDCPLYNQEFYCRPSWYKRQRRSIIKKWHPVLVDTDQEKVKRLLSEDHEEQEPVEELATVK